MFLIFGYCMYHNVIGQRALSCFHIAKVTVWLATQGAHGQAVLLLVPMNEVSLAAESINKEFEMEFRNHEISLEIHENVCKYLEREKNFKPIFFFPLNLLAIFFSLSFFLF